MAYDQIYYEDQSGWSPEDYYGLWRYLNRLFQSIGPNQALVESYHADLSERDRARRDRVAPLQAKRTGQRDDELASLDLRLMTHRTRYLMKHLLISQKRYEIALERYPNLRGLADVGDLAEPLYLDSDPRYGDTYFTSVGILI